MQYTTTSDTEWLIEGLFDADAIARLRSWYQTAQTEGNIERDIERELGVVIRDAIEGVTNIQPKHIIIDLDRNDTQN